MVSKAPLLLAAVLFAFGLAGLAQTVRQTDDPAARDAGGRLIIGRRPATTTPPLPAPQSAVSAATVEAVPAESETVAVAGSAAAGPSVPPVAEAELSTPTPQPPLGAAIAAAIAADGSEAVGNATGLAPLRIGMVVRESEDEPPVAAPAESESSSGATPDDGATVGQPGAAEGTPGPSEPEETPSSEGSAAETPTPAPSAGAAD